MRRWWGDVAHAGVAELMCDDVKRREKNRLLFWMQYLKCCVGIGSVGNDPLMCRIIHLTRRVPPLEDTKVYGFLAPLCCCRAAKLHNLRHTQS